VTSRAYIGLGTNLGDRHENLKHAKSILQSAPGVKIIRVSSILETKPVDVLDQPDFLNQIALIETSLMPEELLNTLIKIEQDSGRIKTVSRGPRIIDMDILLYDDMVLKSADLIIPHPEIKNRDFILRHLVELDADIKEPVTGMLYRDILANI